MKNGCENGGESGHLQKIDTAGMDLNTQPGLKAEVVRKIGVPLALVGALGGLALGLEGCGSNVEAKKPTGITATNPEKKVDNTPAWEKPYPEDNSAAQDELCYGIIDRDALNNQEKQLLDLDPMSMTNEQSAAFLDMMLGIYRHWSSFPESHERSANQPLPYVYLDGINDKTNPDDIAKNISLITNGLQELGYTYGKSVKSVPDIKLMQQLMIAFCFNQDNRGELAQEALDKDAEIYGTGTPGARIHVSLSGFTVNDYSYDSNTGKAQFNLCETHSSDGSQYDTKFEAYTQKFTDPDGNQKKIVMYNQLASPVSK
ncbi:hypothetical protein FWF48_02980 [Candidatus Saccharibacteria bacterium]|nr:hypothetical protein [Candidatus Saccharibacteria bacterium]